MSKRRTDKGGNHLPPAAGAVELLRQFPLVKMRERPAWIGFRIFPRPGEKPKKEPFCAASPDCYASSTDPATWGLFDDAVRGLADGVFSAAGYALDGDVIGLDLDGQRWVDAGGKLTAEAVDVVRRCGSYAEWSVSRRGLHVLLLGQFDGPGRARHAAGVELYCRGRFFIVTGDALPGVPHALVPTDDALPWIMRELFGESSSPVSTTETTEHMASVDSVLSVVSVMPVDDVIGMTLPTRQGERNACVMRLARGLRFNAGMGDAPMAEYKAIVRRWHALALPVIGTKAFDETWADFTHALRAARLPLDWHGAAWAMRQAQTQPLPPAAAEYDSEKVRLLVGICWWLASLHPDRRFFLSCHDAGGVLGVSHTRAIKWLKMLAVDKVIVLKEAGNERRAHRYQYIHGSDAASRR